MYGLSLQLLFDMSDKTSKDQYGRKTWNVEAYEAEAKRQKRNEASELAKAAALRLGQDHLQHRAELLSELIAQVKKRTLIADPESNFGRKRFGFTCPVCDLSFRDTLALVDHINSPQHARKARELAKLSGSGEGDEIVNEIRHATPEEVSQTIEALVAKKLRDRAASSAVDSIQERVRKRAEFMKKRATKRREKRLKKKEGQNGREGEENSEMARAMGFEQFGSTKVD